MNQSSESNRARLIGLLIDCPFEANPVGCPLHEMRLKPMKERVEWARSLDDEQVKRILEHHERCLAEKEEGERGGD